MMRQVDVGAVAINGRFHPTDATNAARV
jgi:hypothetical protein